MPIKIALPKGKLLADTAALLNSAGWGLSDYRSGARLYHLSSSRFPYLQAKIFQDKDIPVQVAIGNYDLGICGRDWIEELLAKYPKSALIKVRDLDYGRGCLYMLASRDGVPDIKELRKRENPVRIASEYPNLAESYAAGQRLRRFSVFPLWGAAEVYPPESADLALIAGKPGQDIFDNNLVPVSKVLDFNACLVANRNSWENRNMSAVLESIGISKAVPEVIASQTTSNNASPNVIKLRPDSVRIALPDGHQQEPTVELLNKAGFRVEDYTSGKSNHRPAAGYDNVTIKIIRPQDMPLQVANGNFDMAVTGRDWLTNHLYQFPASPVQELLDLKYGKVRIVAVVSEEVPVNDIRSLKEYYAQRKLAIRVASEYISIADKYARDNHLGIYRIIPTWGASESFLPDDADMLIENTQTGTTLARHKLKIIDTLFESTACIIGYKGVCDEKQGKIDSIIKIFRKAVGD